MKIDMTSLDGTSAGNIELSFPTGWQHLANAPTIPGLTFSQPLALGNGSAQRLIAGQVSASGPTLLPSGFATSLNGALPRPEPI